MSGVPHDEMQLQHGPGLRASNDDLHFNLAAGW